MFKALVTRSWNGLHLVVGLKILNVKLLLDLQALQSITDIAGQRVLRGILDSMRPLIWKSRLISCNERILGCDERPMSKRLKGQVHRLVLAVHAIDGRFWAGLLEMHTVELDFIFWG
jgi:hypothetical protein